MAEAGSGTSAGAGELRLVYAATAPREAGNVPQNWRRAALLIALAVPTAAIWGFGGVYSALWVPCSLALFATTAALLCAAAIRGWWLPLPRLLWPMAGFGALVCYQYFLGHTESRSDTLTLLIQLAAAGCVFYLAAVGLAQRRQVMRTGLVLWVLGGAVAIEAILQFFTADKLIYWYRDASYATPVGPFYYHNHFAGCMDLLIPVGLAYALGRPKPGEEVWLAWVRRGLLPALAMVAMILANSRGGLASLGFEAVLFLGLSWKRLSTRGWLLVGATALVLVGAAALANWQPLVARLGMLREQDASEVYRVEVARTCLRIFRDHPWTGTGFGSFVAVYPRYQTFDAGVTWQNAHNEYAQALAETGIVGGATILLFLALWAVRGWQLRTPKLNSAQRIQLGAFVGSGGLLFHSIGDFQFHAPANLWLFFLLVALMAAELPSDAAGSPRRRRRRAPGPAPGALS